MKISATVIAIALLAQAGAPQALAAPASGQSDPTASDAHAAECVAALDVNTQDLAKQVKAGQEDAHALLLERLIAGTAFVGDTYLRGSTDEHQARSLARQALEAQKSLTPDQLAARQTACATAGSRLFEESNGIEKLVVKRLAKKRMDKLLGGG